MTFLRTFQSLEFIYVYSKTCLLSLAVALNAITDSANAVRRLQPIFMAETRPENLPIDPALPVAIRANAVGLTWDAPPATPAPKPKQPPVTAEKSFLGRLKARFGGVKAVATSAPVVQAEKPLSGKPPAVKEPFKMDGLNLEIPRGQLCAIVGPVGSGKSSLLQGLIGGKSNRSTLNSS